MNRPDVYIEKITSKEQPLSLSSTSVGALIGIAPRGQLYEPQLVTSWNSYIKKFAKGLDTPFMKDSYLSDEVYGFFKNGGKQLYVVRVSDPSVSKATIETGSKYTFTAKDFGTWGNNLVVVISTIEGEPSTTKKLDIKLNSSVVETFVVDNTEGSDKYIKDLVNTNSNFIVVSGEQEGALEDSTFTLAGAVEDLSSVSDTEYIKGIKALTKTKVNLVAVPGITSTTVLNALVDFCIDTKAYPIMDTPKGQNADELITFQKSVYGNKGAIYAPWITVNDPLSTNGGLKVCPPSGYVMGVYARTDMNRNVAKAPAGVEATIEGALSLERTFDDEDLGTLNEKCVNCIVAKDGYGIVIWGARNLSRDTGYLYVPDERVDDYVSASAYANTQWVLFEPIDTTLFERIRTSLTGMLQTMYEANIFKGSTPEEAYYVKCDSDLNGVEEEKAGTVIAEIGYAKKKPAEFFVLRVVQKTATSSESK